VFYDQNLKIEMITFYKYHGTGNDFIMIDDRSESFDTTNIELIASMCDRRFGIGADGLILLRNHEEADFEMVYFNSDGRQSSMCGNGGRCIVKFAYDRSVIKDQCVFMAIDGIHEATIDVDGNVKLKMNAASTISMDGDAYVLNTGSPHYVAEVNNVYDLDVKKEGQSIRYSDTYKEEGINVNFISLDDDVLNVVTYERGVEDETYSCGTGVTACALITNKLYPTINSPIAINTKGGQLRVYFDKDNNQYGNIWLYGPAVSVFEGEFKR